jgi:uncharacterized zinc-type alcohol dehydrogenase-like protein
VQIEILFCGICHSDVHSVRDEWSDFMSTTYPIVPGHEIVGRVTQVGSAVTQFKSGDLVGVGCMVDSDGTCPNCKAGFEQFCQSAIFTYNSPDKHKTAPVTYGGYSNSIVVDERFVLRVPETSIWLALHRSCVQASPRIRHSVIGASQRVRKSAWSVWAAWDTWA